jgi:hypothetical protein
LGGRQILDHPRAEDRGVALTCLPQEKADLVIEQVQFLAHHARRGAESDFINGFGLSLGHVASLDARAGARLFAY